MYSSVFGRITVAATASRILRRRRDDDCAISASHSRAARFDQRVEHRLQVEGRAADDLEHVGGGGLLLQRIRAAR